MDQLRTDRRTARGIARRGALLDALEDWFFGHGYRSTTIDELARRLQCSKRTLYEIGSGREALVLKVLERWSGRIMTRAETDSAKAETDDGRIAAYLHPGIEESRHISREFLRDVGMDEEVAAYLRHHQKRRVAGLRDIIQRGVTSGSFRSVNSSFVAAIALAAIERIDDPSLLAMADMEFAEGFHEFYALLIAGLRRPD